MKQLKNLFSGKSVAVATTGAAAAVGSTFASAADGDISSSAVAAITAAQSSGITVGGAVVATVAAMCVVGIVLSMIRKV